MNYNIQMRIADNLRILRHAMRLTQSDLARVLSVDRSTIALLESGRKIPDIDLFYRLSQFYNLPMEAIMEQEASRLLRIALSNNSFSLGEKKLLLFYRRLPPYAKGQLMERAESLDLNYNISPRIFKNQKKDGVL